MTCLFSKRPNYIKLEEMATESVLKAFCKALKIKLVKERLPLRDLNDAWEYLHNYTMDMETLTALTSQRIWLLK